MLLFEWILYLKEKVTERVIYFLFYWNDGKIIKIMSVFSGQLSVISFQFSVFSFETRKKGRMAFALTFIFRYQLSAVSNQFSAIRFDKY